MDMYNIRICSISYARRGKLPRQNYVNLSSGSKRIIFINTVLEKQGDNNEEYYNVYNMCCHHDHLHNSSDNAYVGGLR